LSFDRGDGRPTTVLGEKPRLRQRTGALRANDSTAVHRHPQVVTDTAADGAGDVVDALQHGGLLSFRTIYFS
jgi:hypothetical protein